MQLCTPATTHVITHVTPTAANRRKTCTHANTCTKSPPPPALITQAPTTPPFYQPSPNHTTQAQRRMAKKLWAADTAEAWQQTHASAADTWQSHASAKLLDLNRCVSSWLGAVCGFCMTQLCCNLKAKRRGV